MAYNNNLEKTTLIKLTGSELIAGTGAFSGSAAYTIDISSLIDDTNALSTNFSMQDEFIVVRKFDASTISDGDYTHASAPITADEAWSAWTLPNPSSSGSTMYSLDEVAKEITFNTDNASSEWVWNTTQSGRAADITLPVIAAADEIYVLRRTYSFNKLVQWTAGGRITASNLEIDSMQSLFVAQELLSNLQNIHKINPAVGQPNGICPLNASGIIANTYIDPAVTLALNTGDGIDGTGSAAAPLKVDLATNSGLAIDSTKLKVDTVDSLGSTDEYKPLSAKQGKTLNDLITSLGTGITYKGAGDVTQDATYNNIFGGEPETHAASAGDTVSHTGTGTTAHAEFGGITVAQYDTIRYNGSTWAVVDSNAYIRTDGTTALHANQTATTQSVSDSDTSVATTAFVHAVADAVKLSELADVDTDTDDAAGNMIYWDGNSWAEVALNDTTPGSNKIITTGDSIGTLSDVNTTGVGSNKILKYSGSEWAIADADATSFVVTVAGAVTGDASEAVNDVFSNVNLGTNTTLGMDTSVIGIGEFLGQTRYIGGGSTQAETVTLPARQNVIYRNGTLKHNKTHTTNNVMIEYNPTNSQETYLTQAARKDDEYVVVNAVTNLNVGDMVEIRGYNSTNPLDVDVWMLHSTESDLNAVKHYSYYLGVIKNIDTTAKKIYFEESLPANFSPYVDADTPGSYLKRVGEGSNGQDQLSDIVFENMVFEDSNSAHYYLDENPITFTSGSNAYTWTIDSGNSINDGGSFLFLGADTSTPETGVNRTNNTDETTYWQDLNDWTEITSRATNTITAPIRGGYTCTATGDDGGTLMSVLVSRQQAIKLTYAHNITFRNCTFKGFNGNAIFLRACDNVLIENCTFKQCRPATGGDSASDACIQLLSCSNITIKDCKFQECTQAIKSSWNDHGRAPCRNIYILNNKIEATRPIHFPYSVAGSFHIKDNILKGYIIDKRREHTVRTRNSGSNACYNFWSAIDLENVSAQDCVITGNSLNQFRRIPANMTVTSDTTNRPSTTTYWTDGYGQKQSALAYASSNDYAPWFAYGIEVCIQRETCNFGHTTDALRLGAVLVNGPEKIKIQNNSIATWYSSGISVSHRWNSLSTSNIIGGLDVSNNSISSNGIGIETRFKVGAAAGTSNYNAWRGMDICHNTVGHIRAFHDVNGTPGPSDQGVPTHYGIYMRNNLGGADYDYAPQYRWANISFNKCIGPINNEGNGTNLSGIGIRFGDKAKKLHTNMEAMYLQNMVVGYYYNLYWTESHNDTAFDGHVRTCMQSILFSPTGVQSKNSGDFEYDNNNNGNRRIATHSYGSFVKNPQAWS